MKRFFIIFFLTLFFFTNTHPSTITEQLVKLSDLYTKGLITKEEFEKAKSIILKIKESHQEKIKSVPKVKKTIEEKITKKKLPKEKKDIGEAKIRRYGQRKVSVDSNKSFEKMEMVIGNYRFYTHRPGGIKVNRISDGKQLAVIGDNLKVKYYNNGRDYFDIVVDQENLELIFKINNIGVLLWSGRYIEEHKAHFYQVLAMGSKPFHYYAKLDKANAALALNMERFDKKIEKALEKVKVKLAREHNVTIEQIEQMMIDRESKAASKISKKLNIETGKIIKEAIDSTIDEELKAALEQTLGMALAEGFIEAIEGAFGESIEASIEAELAEALDEAIEEAINEGISRAAIAAGLAAFLDALASGASIEEALAAGDAACNC